MSCSVVDSVKMHLSFIIVLFLCLSFTHGQSLLRLPQMELYLSGKIMTTRNGRNISAYLGIPYAEPPVGSLRFKAPQPSSLYNRYIKADTDGNECPQFNDDGKLVGDEDCLFLNVYSPNTYPEKLYPTMVYFHGGLFFLTGSGSSTNAGPEYLLDKDIILVTVNYRLGVLGFLSTGDAEAPGNFGLKDQVLALKWIQLNIASFGGDPTKVTIFGQGAGGVSTSLHAIFKANSGLFSQYISQSGIPGDVWSDCQEIDDYKKRAFELGNYLKCPTENSQVLVNCLRKRDAYSLVDTFDIFNDFIFPSPKWVLRTWGPTTEPRGLEGAFMTEYSVQQLSSSVIKDCPAILGNVFDEGLLLTAEYYANDTVYNSMRKYLFDYLKYVISISFDAKKPRLVAKNARKFYFDSVPSSDKKNFAQNMSNFLSDLTFRYPMRFQERTTVYANQNPLYVYSFDYRGTFSKTSATLGNNDNIGVTHGDDLIYLFPIKTSDIQLNESDQMMIDIMVDFWTSFAYTGIPISEHISDPNVWKPYTVKAPKSLKIGDDSGATNVKEHLAYDSRLGFWDVELSRQLSGLFLSSS